MHVSYFDRDAGVTRELDVPTDCVEVRVPAGDGCEEVRVNVNTDMVLVDSADGTRLGGLRYIDLIAEAAREAAPTTARDDGATAEQLAVEFIPPDLAGAEWDRRRASLVGLGRELLLALACARSRPATVRSIIAEIAEQNGWDDAKALDVVCEFLESTKHELRRCIHRPAARPPAQPPRPALKPARALEPGPVPAPRPYGGVCRCEEAGMPVPGIVWFPDQDRVPDEPIQKVEACSSCDRYPSDDDAARVVAAQFNLPAVFLEDRPWDVEEDDRGHGYGCFGVRNPAASGEETGDGAGDRDGG
jgi:hypothetical protein